MLADVSRSLRGVLLPAAAAEAVEPTDGDGLGGASERLVPLPSLDAAADMPLTNDACWRSSAFGMVGEDLLSGRFGGWWVVWREEELEELGSEDDRSAGGFERAGDDKAQRVERPFSWGPIEYSGGRPSSGAWATGVRETTSERPSTEKRISKFVETGNCSCGRVKKRRWKGRAYRLLLIYLPRTWRCR